jgi:tRNA(adenine34) deaminase
MAHDGTIRDDERWMQRCLELAQQAAAADEVPVGALVVLDGVVVGEGRNRVEAQRSPLAHAERRGQRTIVEILRRAGARA